MTTTQVTLVQSSSINQQQKITTSIISTSTSQSTTTTSKPYTEEQQRSRSSTGCLLTKEDDSTKDPNTQSPIIQGTQTLTKQSLNQISSPRTSSPAIVKQTVSLTKSDQNSPINSKSQKQSRRPSNNRLTNETTIKPETQNNRSMRNRNLILQHQLHKSISTPTLIVHEEQTPNQPNERSSALSKIKNKFTGNSSNSNISALKAGTTNLFFTVRDKLKNE